MTKRRLKWAFEKSTSILGCCKSIEKCKSATVWHSTPDYPTSTESIPIQSSHRVRKYFDIIILKPVAFLSDNTRRKKCWKNGRLLRFCTDLAFWITRSKCMQNTNGLKISRLALQRIALLKVYKNPGPNLSCIRDCRQCSNFEVHKSGQKQLKFEAMKCKYFNFCVNCRSKSYKL